MRPTFPVAIAAGLTLAACASMGLDRDADAGGAGGAGGATSSGPPSVPPSLTPAGGGGGAGGTGGGTGGMPLPPTQGPTSPPTAAPTSPSAPGQCTPGLCLECDAAGRGIIPEDDDNCPGVDCASLDTYQLESAEGVMIFRRQVHLATGHRCVGPGQCRNVPDAVTCGDVRPVEETRLDTPCQVIGGCNGNEPPRLDPAAEGLPCGDAGLCEPNGECNTGVARHCYSFQGAQVCGEGVDVNALHYCDITAADQSCRDACLFYQGSCLAAFISTPEAPCGRGEAVGCLEPRAALRCRCLNPHP